MMTIKKYSSLEQAEKDLWVLHPDESYYKRLRQLFELWHKISSRTVRKGIQKFSSVKLINETHNL